MVTYTGPDGMAERRAIIAQASSLCGGRVYGDLPEAQQIPRDATTGEILPYIVITFSSPAPTGSGRTLGGTALDQPYDMGVQVDCWGMNADVAGSTAGAARTTLIGFVPNTSCGELEAVGGAQFAVRSNGSLPSRVLEQVRMLLPMNLGIN